MAKLIGQENKNSNLHNVLHGNKNNQDELLNQICMMYVCMKNQGRASGPSTYMELWSKYIHR